MNFYPISMALCLAAMCAEAQAPRFTSVIGAGGTRQNYGNAIAIDSAGNSYVAGSLGLDPFGGSMDIGTNHLVSMGSTDGFVAKFNPQGVCLWVRQIEGLQNDDAYAVAVRSDNSIVIAGEFLGTNFIGGNTLISHGGFDIFLAAYSSTGDVLWAKAVGADMDDFAIALNAGPAGSVFFTGSFSGNMNLGPGMNFSSADEDALLIKLDIAGGVQWASTADGPGVQFGSAVKLDPGGNVFWAGEFDSAISFGNTNFTSPDFNIFLAKYDSDGNRIFVRKLGTGDQAQLPRLAFASDGRMICSALYFGDYSIDGQSLPSGQDDVLIASFDPGGDLQWVSIFGGAQLEACTALVLDQSGDCYAIGHFRGTLSAGSADLTSAGDSDVFVVRCTANGELNGAVRAGGPGPDLVVSAAMTDSGELRLTGSFYGTAQFGTLSVTSPDLVPKMFLATMAPAPRLRITSFSDHVLVSWPGSATGFTLETKSALEAPSWSPVANPPVLLNGEFTVSNRTSNPMQFFRLRN